MGWRRQRWQEGAGRPVRPKVRSLSVDERVNYLKAMIRAIERSPVLTALSFDVRILRGRFYVERHSRDADGALIDTEPLGRITPLADAAASLLLEVEFRAGSWSEITEGSVQKLMNAIANDTKGTFHGLGALNKSLRKTGQEPSPSLIEMRGKAKFIFSETGQPCSVQEALFHYFQVPIHVIAEPRIWYQYHRIPQIVEVSQDRRRVLVRFSASSLSGEFEGTCLYVCRDGTWEAYTIKPSESDDIGTAETWLAKRKWRAWT